MFAFDFIRRKAKRALLICEMDKYKRSFVDKFLTTRRKTVDSLETHQRSFLDVKLNIYCFSFEYFEGLVIFSEEDASDLFQLRVAQRLNTSLLFHFFFVREPFLADFRRFRTPLWVELEECFERWRFSTESISWVEPSSPNDDLSGTDTKDAPASDQTWSGVLLRHECWVLVFDHLRDKKRVKFSTVS